MLETFCAAARVKAILREPGAPDVISKAAEILLRCCAPFADEVFRTDTGILRTATESIPYVSHNDANIIETPISDVLKQAWEKADTHISGNDNITEYKRLQIAGLQYSTRKHSTSDSCVFLQNTSGEFGPGVIEHMFSVGQDHDRAYYIAIRCYLPTPAEYEDPFQEYSDFGAQIWSCAYTSQLDIVPVCTGRICHAISMDWGTSEVVLKPMNRVSSQRFISHSSANLPGRTTAHEKLVGLNTVNGRAQLWWYICKQDSTSKMSIAISLLFPF